MLVILLFAAQIFSQDLYITEERATLWNANDPGYTFQDCKKPTEHTYITCDRRIAWPAGGDKVTQTAATQTIRGRKYSFVQVRGQYGWLEDRFINKNNNSISSTAFMYTEAGLDQGKCRQAESQLTDCFFTCASQGKGEKEASCINSCKIHESDVKACQNKTILSPGTKLSSVAPSKFSINNEDFYFVNYSKEGKTASGWIYEGSLAKTSLESSNDDDEATEGGTDCLTCQIPTEPEPTEFEKAIINVETGGYKSSAELEKFACMHTSSLAYGGESKFSKQRFCDYYKNTKPSIKAQIAKAAAAFQLPEAVIACTMLAESAMYFRPDEKKHYRGFFQFGASAVKDLKRYINNPPYKKMWSSYTPRPTSEFNDDNMRNKRDIEIAVGGAALYAKWFFIDRIPKTGCKDCSGDTAKPNKKDVDLFTAGFNWSPYGTGKIAHLTSNQLRNRGIEPPPKETRNYFKKMDKCMQPGQFNSFTSDRPSGTSKTRGEKCNGPC